MGMDGWFRHYPSDTSPTGETIIAAINRCGVTLERARKCPPIGAGVVLFDFVDTQLCEQLEHYSRRGFDRVLAVATCSNALAGGEVWRLLEAGAADVFAWDAIPDPAATVAA